MRSIIVTAIFLALALPARAEFVNLKDGTRIDALSLSDAGDSVSAKTKHGELRINKTDIENLSSLSIYSAAGPAAHSGLQFKTETLPDSTVKIDYFLDSKLLGTQMFSQTGELIRSNGQLPDGVYREYYPDGKVRKEKMLLNQQNNGTFKAFYPDGKVQNEVNFVNGKINGAYKYYADNGNLIVEKNYVNGIPNGYFREFDDNGMMKTRVLYVNGEIQPEPSPVAVSSSRGGFTAVSEKRNNFFLEPEIYSVGGANSEWKKNFNAAINFLGSNFDYAGGEMTTYPGIGLKAGVNLRNYSSSPVYLAFSYVKGPSAELEIDVVDSVWGSGVFTEDIETYYYRFMCGYKYVSRMSDTSYFLLDINAGLGGGSVESEYSYGGSIATALGLPRSGSMSENWTGFSWGVGPGFSWEYPNYIIELGARYTMFPKLSDSDDFADIEWKPFSLFMNFIF